MDWLFRKWAWANENRLFWANLVLAGAVVVFTFILPAPDASDFRVRTLGMMLQLIGVLTVWLDLTATARHFGKTGFMRRTWRWLKAGIFGRNVVIALQGAAMAVTGGRAHLKVRKQIQAGAPLPDRVAALEALAGQIDDDLDKAYAEIDKRAGELDIKIKAEATERDRAITDVKHSLENAATGNYTTLAFGAFWLGVGIVLATWAPEIAKLAAGQWTTAWKAV